MRRIAWAALVLLPLYVVFAGCGRPVVPGTGLRGAQPKTDTGPGPSSAAPKDPFWEAGPADAKVRVLAFATIDPEHKVEQEVLKSLVKEYPGKLYVKYIDIRTPEGQQSMQRANTTGTGVLVNGESTVEIKSANPPYQANFGGEMGRYWTADDLKAAVAQEVAKAYGK